MDRKIVIADLDGTIALIDHRRHLVSGDKKNWEAFYQACEQDKPNKPIINLLRALYQDGYVIYIFSGRSMMVEVETRRWLTIHDVPYYRLKMRKINDNTPDEVLKLMWLKELDLKDKVEFVIDDREKVVRMWRAEGLTCLQVDYGEF